MTESKFEQRLGAAIRDEMPPLRAPEELRQRVRAVISNAPASQKTALWGLYTTRARWLALAASLVLVTLGGAAGWQLAVRRAGDAALADQVLASHVRSLMPGHLTDVLSSDQHTVKPWFNGKVDFSPQVYDFTASGYPLIGGRLDYVASRPVAALAYGRRKHIINVLLWPAASGSSDVSTQTRQGYHLLHWTADGYTYWVVSDLGLPELREFTQLLRSGGP